MSYNKNHAASIQYVEDAITNAYEKVQIWVETNADKLDYVKRILLRLANAYRDSTFSTSAYEYSVAIDNAVTAMVTAFTEAGVDMTGLTMADFAQCIAIISQTSGTFIKDADGGVWTAASWAAAKEAAGGVDPATKEGITLTAGSYNLRVATSWYGPSMFGTYSHTIPNLDAFSGTVSGEPRNGEKNARKIVAATNPAKLDSLGFALTYYEGMDIDELISGEYDAVFFPDVATLTSWANEMGLSKMVTVGQTMSFYTPYDESDPDSGYYVMKYFNGSSSITFANREATVPYTDSRGAVGCPPSEACVDHREHADDVLFWRIPSLFEYLLIYLNLDAINECYDALGVTRIPYNNNFWSGLQYNNNTECSFNLGTGSYSNLSKSVTFYVIPVASSVRPSAA